MKRQSIKQFQPMIAIILGLALTIGAGCDQFAENKLNTKDDLCGAIIAGSSENYPDKLREASVGSDLVSQFPPKSLSCSSKTEEGISRRCYIYITFEDDHGAVVVAAVLHENEDTSKWKTDINKILYRLDLVYDEVELEDGSFLLGWSSNHPRVEEAQNLHAESIDNISLADIVSRLSDERVGH